MSMRVVHGFIVALAAALIAGCSPQPLLDEVTVVADAEHDYFGNNSALQYEIAPARSLRLVVPEELVSASRPTEIHVISVRDDGYYYFRAPWVSGTTEQLLSRDSLSSVNGRAFPGFRADESWVVGIGSEAYEPGDDALQLESSWKGVFVVKAPSD